MIILGSSQAAHHKNFSLPFGVCTQILFSLPNEL